MLLSMCLTPSSLNQWPTASVTVTPPNCFVMSSIRLNTSLLIALPSFLNCGTVIETVLSNFNILFSPLGTLSSPCFICYSQYTICGFVCLPFFIFFFFFFFFLFFVFFFFFIFFLFFFC